MSSSSSPSSSPRLPSPPPMAEDQLAPKSPGVQAFEDHGMSSAVGIDAGAARRIRPGTRAEHMAEGPPLVELQDIETAFQLTEHLKALHYSHTHPEDQHSTVPITPEIARRLASPPPNTTKEIWLYELGRFLIQKTNSIIVALFADNPPCSTQTCPEMRASEWQYLCAVHDPPKACSAINYCCHTLDSAASTLTSSKMFPSRLALGSSAAGAGISAGGGDKVLQLQMKELTSIFRRVYRIYAHAWFQHREMFWRVEGKTGLYVLFKTVCDEYGLIPPENYTIPPEAEGAERDDNEEMERLPAAVLSHISVLQRDNGGEDKELGKVDTTKRHPRHALSNSTSVAGVIHEEAEEEDDSAEKPTLGRQMTALKSSDDDDADPTSANVDPPIGFDRSDTVKPEKPAPQADDDSTEVTVIETEPDDKSKASDEATANSASEESAKASEKETRPASE